MPGHGKDAIPTQLAIYSNEGQREAGELIGLGAGRLGLFRRVRTEAFLPVGDNPSVSIGEALPERLNITPTTPSVAQCCPKN
jgi:hypothetical protein